MRRFRRVTAVFVSVFLANLTWVGSGYACVMPPMAHTVGASAQSADVMTDDTAGMNMSQAAPGMHQAARDSAPPQNAPCRFPWAPDGCVSMAPCAPVAVASHALVLDAPNVTPLDASAMTVLTPPSELPAPDVPPPR